MASNAEKIEDLAKEEGFDLAGYAPADPPPDARAFERFLGEGRHGAMGYLERNRERILEPRRLLRGARGILSLGLGHARAAGALPGGGRVARYALGRDYHRVLGRMVRRLLQRLRRLRLVSAARAVADAGPLLERSHARRAGVGFLGKSANLLDRRHGPWFFLAELVADAEPDGRSRRALGSCGACRACLDACPTGAILEPFVVDARRCVSYQTIENRGAIPEAMREGVGEWVFGCDVCSEVCPFGFRAPDASARFGSHPVLERPLGSLFELDEDSFASAFEGSALKRPKRAGLLRNAAVVLGNRRDPSSVPALARALADPSPLVRSHAAWGLGRIGGGEARGALERSRRAERDPDVRREIEEALARA